jgi:cytochrome d ubiquinol oxidase subunit I
VKFVHTVSAGYTTGACFVLGISAWYLLHGRHIAFAQRSFAIAAAFGLASVLSVITLGDESGYELGHVQKVKLAAIEGMWETHPPPAPFTVIGFIDQDNMRTNHAIEVPWMMGLIATRSLTEPVTGLKDLSAEHERRIRNGMHAYAALQQVRANPADAAAKARLKELSDDLGYGLLLKRHAPNVVDATEAQIALAVRDALPPVKPLFWAFRIMVGAGFFMLVVFVLALVSSSRRAIMRQRWLLKLAVVAIPMPWIASEMGWLVAELGRQPWTVAEVLPTWMSVSSLSVGDLVFSLCGFVLLYTALLVVELYLMLKFARKGPADVPGHPAAQASAPSIA